MSELCNFTFWAGHPLRPGYGRCHGICLYSEGLLAGKLSPSNVLEANFKTMTDQNETVLTTKNMVTEGKKNILTVAGIKFSDFWHFSWRLFLSQDIYACKNFYFP